MDKERRLQNYNPYVNIYRKGPFFKGLFILLLSTICSCALFLPETGIQVNKEIFVEAKEDYVDHFKALGQFFVKTKGKKVMPLSKASQKYLNGLFQIIIQNNELLLTDRTKPIFYVIQDKTPYYFSLPGNLYFISSVLMSNKYIKNEAVFVSMLANIIIQSQLGIYKREFYVPVGYINDERIIALTRLEIELKHEINQWTYYVLKRSGFDPFAYLKWLQIQNKNALPFSALHGKENRISREEYLFKNFIIETERAEVDDYEYKSSKEFYQFKKETGKI